jgi:predicted nucleotidyltransferase
MRPSQVLHHKKDAILQIIDKYSKIGFINLSFFGSVARGDDNDDSDIDIVYEVDYNIIKDFTKYFDLEDELIECLGVKIDLISLKYIHPMVYNRIIHELLPVSDFYTQVNANSDNI